MTMGKSAYASGDVSKLWCSQESNSSTCLYPTKEAACLAKAAGNPYYNYNPFVVYSGGWFVGYTCYAYSADHPNWGYQSLGWLVQGSTSCPANSTSKSGAFCTCNSGYQPDSTGTSCVEDQYKLALIVPPDYIEPPNLPWNTRPTSALLTVKVTDQNDQPKQDIHIQMSVTVVPNSGGHLHQADRDLGRLKNASCGMAGNPLSPCESGATGPDGTTGFTYTAPELSGIYQFTATCVSPQCAGMSDMKSIKVMLGKLTQIPTSPDNCYTLTDANGVIGAVENQHIDNHWVRNGVPQRLNEFACKYNGLSQDVLQITDKRLYINDASLNWGGLFRPHDSHRFGWSVDIRVESSAQKAGEVPLVWAKQLMKIESTSSGQVNAQIHCHKDGNIVIAKFGKSSTKCDNNPDGRHLHVDFK